MASSSAVMEQPNMQSDSAGAAVAELEDIVVSSPKPSEEIDDPPEDPPTGALWLKGLKECLRVLRNSSIQIPKELTTLGSLSEDTIGVVEDALRYRDDIMVKLWLAEVKEVLSDAKDIILYEIKDANIFELTAEVQSSANKPWKRIVNLFKISRFMHYYREKRMVSKVKYITVGLGEFRDEGKQLLKKILDERTQCGIQCTCTSAPPAHFDLPGRYSLLITQDAISKGRFWKVKHPIESNPDELSTTLANWPDALLVAIITGQQTVAKELIRCTSSESSLLLKVDESGKTALSLAARSGMMEIAKSLIEKNEDLLTIPDKYNKLPVQLACRAGHEDMTRCLYRYTSQKFDCNTSKKFLDGDYGFYLLEECITKKMFDIALHLLYSFPKFGIYSILKEGVCTCPIAVTLAQTQPPFFRKNQLSFWKRWIYNCTRVKVDKGTVLANGVSFIVAQRSEKKISDLKLMDATALEIIRLICRQLSALDQIELGRSGAVEATFQAIKNGLPAIAIGIAIAIFNTNVLCTCTNILSYYSDPEDSNNMFACAVAHRQEEMTRFLYEFNAISGADTIGACGNNLLHLAANLAPGSHLDCISGAALQLQSELR